MARDCGDWSWRSPDASDGPSASSHSATYTREQSQTIMSAVKDEDVRIGGALITSKYMRRAHSTSFWFANSSKAYEV
jgi:hypothetical protein